MFVFSVYSAFCIWIDFNGWNLAMVKQIVEKANIQNDYKEYLFIKQAKTSVSLFFVLI